MCIYNRVFNEGAKRDLKPPINTLNRTNVLFSLRQHTTIVSFDGVSNLGLVNLSKVFIGAVLVRFWGTSIFSIGPQYHAPNFSPVFFSPGYALPVVG